MPSSLFLSWDKIPNTQRRRGLFWLRRDSVCIYKVYAEKCLGKRVSVEESCSGHVVQEAENEGRLPLPSQAPSDLPLVSRRHFKHHV